jgi:hypothetical protein
VLGALCVRAWNDWMVDEWCATAPGRYIPLMVIPLWGPVGAAAGARHPHLSPDATHRGVAAPVRHVPATASASARPGWCRW